MRPAGHRCCEALQIVLPFLHDAGLRKDDISISISVAAGIPVRVFRPVASADLRVLIGSVLPHLQAGFGGGWKLIFPGTSHRSTLGALHRRVSMGIWTA
jgi:nickel-dependent lactate racemase